VETNRSTGLAERISKATSGLSVRKVESTSLTQTMAFNPHNLKLFSKIWKPYAIALKFYWKWSGI